MIQNGADGIRETRIANNPFENVGEEMDDGDVPNSKLCKAFNRPRTFDYDLEKENDDAASCATNDKADTNGDRTSVFVKEVDLKASNLSRLQSGSIS